MSKNILLLDGYNLMYRARYSGMNRGEYSTIFNFFRGLRPLIEKFNPDQAYFVLEGIPKKRLSLNEDYKGQREYHNKDGFTEQRREIINMLREYIPITLVKHDDYECDDVINYLAKVMHANENVTIVSSDTDFIQSVSENISLYNPVRKKYIESTKYDYVMWKSLVGDKSDNISGFKGIGDKRAQSLLSSPENLEEFLNKAGNRNIFENNMFMIKFHDLTEDASKILYHRPSTDDSSWIQLKEKFASMDFNSIVGKDKTWNKYVNTFKNLERNNNDSASINK